MAINSIAARNAYGIPDAASRNSQLDPNKIKANVREGLQELSDITYTRKVVVKAQEPAAQAASSEAATAVFSNQQKQSPQKLEEGKVKSLLAEGEDADIPLPSRGDVENLARRYLKVTGASDSGKAADEKAKQLADFYGANPGRAERFAALVSALEQGDETKKEAQPSVAIA